MAFYSYSLGKRKEHITNKQVAHVYHKGQHVGCFSGVLAIRKAAILCNQLNKG